MSPFGNDPSKVWSFLASEELRQQRKKVDWSGIQLNHLYYNYLVTGNPTQHYLSYFIEKYIPEPVIVLSLGCGNGHLERCLVDFALPYKCIVGTDLNLDLLKFASNEAKQKEENRTYYFLGDLNSLVLPKNKFGLVIFFHSLHHITNLERVMENVRQTLTSDGILLVVDFFGPTRFQWTDIQIELTQQLLDLLPFEMRKNLRDPYLVEHKNVITRPNMDDLVRADPSEAVRSAEIYILLKEKFNIIEEKPLGGTLLSLLFDGIAGNFDEKNPIICSLIKSLQKTEELLILNKVIPSDYLFLVLQIKDNIVA